MGNKRQLPEKVTEAQSKVPQSKPLEQGLKKANDKKRETKQTAKKENKKKGSAEAQTSAHDLNDDGYISEEGKEAVDGLFTLFSRLRSFTDQAQNGQKKSKAGKKQESAKTGKASAQLDSQPSRKQEQSVQSKKRDSLYKFSDSLVNDLNGQAPQLPDNQVVLPSDDQAWLSPDIMLQI